MTTARRSGTGFLESLDRPVVGAPMAGGPTTPELVAAVESAGGIGFLAAGYQTAAQLTADIAAVRRLGCSRFGVNLFVSLDDDSARAASQSDVDAYAARLAPTAAEVGAVLPEAAEYTDYDFAAKVDALVEDPVPVVSFTFGCPDPAVIQRLQQAGSEVAVTVADTTDAVAAARAGADVLVVQGYQAGGHRSTFSIAAEPNRVSTPDLVHATQLALRAAGRPLPIIASGGIHSRAAVILALEAGAVAVQLGTLLLDSDEAGTPLPYRQKLAAHYSTSPEASSSVVTRCFSGRPARVARNHFVDTHHDKAPAAYPMSNILTGPIRRAAASTGRPEAAEYMAIFCGEALVESPTRDAEVFPPAGSARCIIDDLWKG